MRQYTRKNMSKYLRKLITLGVILLLSIGFLCACGSSGSGDAGDTADSTEATEAAADAQADTSADAEEPTTAVSDDGVTLSNDSSDFVEISEVVPDAILEIRYYSTYNFVGDRIDGYEEPIAFMTKEGAEALIRRKQSPTSWSGPRTRRTPE